MCIGIEVRRTGASGVSGAISERGFRAKKHKESGGARLPDKTADAMAAANFVPPPPSQPPPPPPPLPAPSLPFPSFFFLFLFSSGALSSCSAVVPPEGFKNNSVNCIPVRRETEKSGWKKTSDSRRSMVEVVVVVAVERGVRRWGGAVSIVVAAAWYRPGSFLPRK